MIEINYIQYDSTNNFRNIEFFFTKKADFKKKRPLYSKMYCYCTKNELHQIFLILNLIIYSSNTFTSSLYI